MRRNIISMRLKIIFILLMTTCGVTMVFSKCIMETSTDVRQKSIEINLNEIKNYFSRFFTGKFSVFNLIFFNTIFLRISQKSVTFASR